MVSEPKWEAGINKSGLPSFLFFYELKLTESMESETMKSDCFLKKSARMDCSIVLRYRDQFLPRSCFIVTV
jgi:hypothetical protein